MTGLLIFLLLCPALAWADTLYLKDGRIVRGEIVSETDEVVSVKEPIGTSGYAQARYPKTQIERIERPAAASIPPPSQPAAPPPVRGASSATDRRADDSLAYKLATIDSTGYVSKDHVTVARFRSLLNQLSAKFVEDEQQIADMTAKARQMLRADGIEESLLNMMEGMNQLFIRTIENQQYAEYIAAYITLRSKGESHADAISGLQGILRAVGAR